MWKANYLSFGGRIAFIKVALHNLPIYLLSLLEDPKGVVKEIELLQRNLLW